MAADSVTIPDVSVYDAVFGDITDEHLDTLAVFDSATGTETTYRELIAAIDAVAGALAARGLGSGQVVGLLAPNTLAFVIVFHAVLRAGATVTTVNSLSTRADIARQLEMAGAKALFTVSPLAEHAVAAAGDAGIADDHVVVMDGAEGYLSLQDLIAEGHTAPEVAIDPMTHIAVIPFSSGTTGVPKGVQLSHHNLVANVVQSQHRIRVDEGGRVLAVLPFFHI